MLIETLILTMVACVLIKRNTEWIYNIKFDWIALVFTAFFMESILNLMCNYSTRNVINWVTDYTLYFQMAIYVLLFAFVIKNRRVKGILIMAVGFMLNAFVILANRGLMPVSIKMGVLYNFDHTLFELQNQHVFGHAVLTTLTKWPILADVIDVPPPYLWPKTISVGDVFIDMGLVFMILSACFYKKKHDTENK